MNDMTSEFALFGADKISVQVTGTPLKRGLIYSDIKKLENIENVRGVSPTFNGSTTIVASGKEKTNIFQGKNDVYFSKSSNIVETGRSINILDIKSENRSHFNYYDRRKRRGIHL